MSAALPGTLIYANNAGGENTDRVIDLAGTTGNATIQSDGSGALMFSNPFTASDRRLAFLDGASGLAHLYIGFAELARAAIGRLLTA